MNLAGDEWRYENRPIRALGIVRRGLRRTPSLVRPFLLAALMGLGVACGRLAVPVLVQQVFDRGLLVPGEFQAAEIWQLAGLASAVIAAMAIVAPIAAVQMAKAAYQSLYELRRDVFAHIHRLSLVTHSEERRGRLLARVTSDIDALGEFVEWGAISWAIDLTVIFGAVGVMFFYSWQLALVAVALLVLVLQIVRWLQRRQLEAYTEVRSRVGDLLGEFDETVAGAASVRAYGFQGRARQRLERAIVARYRADMKTSRYYAGLYTIGDLVGAVAIGGVAIAAITWGPQWGLDAGETVAFFFLVGLIQNPIAELTEVLDQTQAAAAGWGKVLGLLDTDPEVAEPVPGEDLPHGPLSVEAVHVHAQYGDLAALNDVSVHIPAGTAVAIVGQTGAGKTTFARLLCRLLDPSAGSVLLGGVDLRRASADARHRAVRMVPQDGFLFDVSVAENVLYGRPHATRADVEAAVDALGLRQWVERLRDGLDTSVGIHGDGLSVGERQLVALLRSQVADPGLLILDEATSSIDPQTEQALARALETLGDDRTMVSVAHRISTAERSDLVLVFADGRLIEQGSPAELRAAGGHYTRLVEAWERAVAEI